MYLTSSLSTPLARASRFRFTSSLSTYSSLSRSLAASSHSSVSPPSPPSLTSSRSLSFSTAFRSLRSSNPRWSHGYDWRSPVSLRAQIRTAAPLLEQFQRKMATMGMIYVIL